MVLGLALDQAVASPKRAVPVPDGANEGVTSIAVTNSDVKAYFGRSHFCSSGTNTHVERVTPLINSS
jgi:hypothetical protein